MNTPTETELKQDYHAFCEMMRRLSLHAWQQCIKGDVAAAQEIVGSLMEQAIAKKVSLETQEVLQDESRFDLAALPKPGADDGLE